MVTDVDPSLNKLVDEAREAVGEPEKWLETPHDLHGGIAPIELARRGATESVRALLRSIKQGDFT